LLPCSVRVWAAPVATKRQGYRAPLADKLALLQELRTTSDKRFLLELAGLQRTIESSGNPGLIYQLMSWQNTHGLLRDTVNCAARLSNNLSKRLPIPIACCDALMALGDWLNVRIEVARADWGWMNHLRLAIYARVEQVLGVGKFQDRWESAIVATAGDWSALVSLANLAQRWGWQQQAVETLWLIARQPEGQHAALQQLYTFYERERNLTQLYKVAKRYWEVLWSAKRRKLTIRVVESEKNSSRTRRKPIVMVQPRSIQAWPPPLGSR